MPSNPYYPRRLAPALALVLLLLPAGLPGQESGRSRPAGPPAAAEHVSPSARGAASGEETALLADGQRVRGRLAAGPTGGLAFHLAEGDQRIPAPRLRRVVFPADRLPVPPNIAWWRMALWERGQVVAGGIRSFDAEQMTLDLLATGEVTVPLGALAGMHSPPTELPVTYNDFEADAEGWTYNEGPLPLEERRALSGTRAVRLAHEQGTATYAFPRPLDAGRVELSFWDSGRVQPGRQWLVELEFDTRLGPQRVRSLLGWTTDTYGLETPHGPSLAVQPLRRKQGWHRLSVIFDQDRLLALVDEAVLTVGEAPAGPLRAVRLVTRPASARRSPESSVARGSEPADENPPVGYVDDFKIQRKVDSMMHQRREVQQDQVLLASGDELFGQVESITNQQVELHGAFGRAVLPWSQVRGIWFRRQAPEAKPVEGLIARIRFQTILEAKRPDWDTLEGALVDVTEASLELEHPFLGRLRLPRHLAREMDVRYAGWRLPIDPAYHHLGDEVQIRGFQLAVPEGSELSAEFRLDEVPTGSIYLAMGVEEMEGVGPGAEFRDQLADGFLRTELYVNDEKIDFLNRHLEGRSRVARRLRVPVPSQALRSGRNTVHLRQRPSRDDPPKFDDCGLFGLALEVEWPEEDSSHP